MEKNFGHEIVPVEVDPTTGDPMITIPYWMMLDLRWEEGDELEWIIDEEDNCLILRKPTDG
jgi:hypothetical protein